MCFDMNLCKFQERFQEENAGRRYVNYSNKLLIEGMS